jgi:hypothetical protein
MSATSATKIKASRATEVCKNFELKAEAQPLLGDGLSPLEFVRVLVERKQCPAAVQFLAHALPAREAVWWGCLCVRHVSGGELPPKEADACKAAVEWVLEPTEDKRKAAQAPGEKAGIGTPAGGLAMATTWTGGSLAPPEAPVVPPGPFVPAKAIAGAILLAATKAPPVKIGDTQRLFVEMGVGVAQGQFVWPQVERDQRR